MASPELLYGLSLLERRSTVRPKGTPGAQREPCVDHMTPSALGPSRQ